MPDRASAFEVLRKKYANTSDGSGRAGRAGLNVPGNLPLQPPSGFISHTASLLLRGCCLAAIFSEPEGLYSVYTPALRAACIFWSAPARGQKIAPRLRGVDEKR
jgi:hypothetical protein